MCSVSLATCSSIDVDVQQQQGARPVEGFRDARRLLEVHLADRPHDPADLIGEVGGDARDLGEHDLAARAPTSDSRRADTGSAASAPRRARGCCSTSGRRAESAGHDRPELGDRHLVIGQDLQQQRLGLDLDAVDLVDQQHDGIVGRDGLEQRTGEQELVGEDVVVDLAPGVAVLVGLDAQQLLLVVPLVQRLGFVESLVALQANQAGAGESATDLASWVLPVPAGPSTRIGLPSRSAR